MNLNKADENTELSALVLRIMDVLLYSRLTQNDFAESIGITKGFLSEIKRGKKDPGLNVVNGILIAFENISAEWLLRGNGSMLLSDPAKFAAENTPPTAEIQKLKDALQQVKAEKEKAERDRDNLSTQVEKWEKMAFALVEKGGTATEKKDTGGVEEYKRASGQ